MKTAILSGQIDALAETASWSALVNSGKLRLLATWGTDRTKSWPKVPTLRDIGIDIVANASFGIGGARGLDPKIVKILHDAFRRGIEEASFVNGIAKFEMEPCYLNTDDYNKFVSRYVDEQKHIIDELGLKIE